MSSAGVVPVSALWAALEAVQAAAWLVGERGEILHINRAARARLERHRAATLDAIRSALHSEIDQFAITELARPDGAPWYLVIEKDTSRLGAAVARWQLTPRQAAVLGQVVQGRSNKTIARTLACAENTVEAHVTALLAKAGVDNRTALVARFYTS